MRYRSQAEAPGTTWGLRALEGRCPRGALPYPYLKTNLRSPSQRETLSPTSGCRRHVQHVCQFKSRDSNNPQQTARPGRAKLPLRTWPDLTGWRLPHTSVYLVAPCRLCNPKLLRSCIWKSRNCSLPVGADAQEAAGAVYAVATGLRPRLPAKSHCLLARGPTCRADPGETQPNFSPILAKTAGVAAVLRFLVGERR